MRLRKRFFLSRADDGSFIGMVIMLKKISPTITILWLHEFAMRLLCFNSISARKIFLSWKNWASIPAECSRRRVRINFSATNYSNPVVADYIDIVGRDLSNNHRCPEDLVGEAMKTVRLIGGALWQIAGWAKRKQTISSTEHFLVLRSPRFVICQMRCRASRMDGNPDSVLDDSLRLDTRIFTHRRCHRPEGQSDLATARLFSRVEGGGTPSGNTTVLLARN